MTRRSILLSALACGLLHGLTACSSTQQEDVQLARPAPGVRLLLEEDGPWNQRIEKQGGTVGGVWRVATDDYAWRAQEDASQEVIGGARDTLEAMAAAAKQSEAPAAKPQPQVPQQQFVAPEPLRHTRATAKATPILPKKRPRRRKDGAPAKAPPKPPTPLHLRFVANPTSVVAATITLAVPPELAREARLKAKDMQSFPGGRRIGTGEARLTLRHLSLAADRITLRVQEDGEQRVQIMARGQVEIDARLDAHQVEHRGLRSLIITDDRMIPLR